ncbi:MAG TPA: malto-oligosyltrehalose trehalohydrolase [Nitrospira sp.]|nr:malto-oligosyltrehalose trehalohydrolase [Nitrospira sp.]
MASRRTGEWGLSLGARLDGPSTTHFRVWAPRADRVAVHLVEPDMPPVPMEPREFGYFEATVPGAGAGARYQFLLDGEKARPDPAARFQPEGVHKPSAVVDPHAFHWTDERWRGLPLKDFVIYELHTGTFTPEGTFDAIIPRLKYLRQEVGMTAIELMPVAQFPGRRNWGYDGVHPFAPQASYGGPEGLKRLVDACHGEGLAVILDVVYNHLGPEGNYLGDFGPYFTDRYRTPWGAAINYDGPESDEVRHFVISNALYWVTEYHIDALRLDSIHGIFDFSARHILQELADAVHAEAERAGRMVFVIAESDLNDARVICPPAMGGFGLDGQWNDDFHHALRVTLTGERKGYYQDFDGLVDLAAALRDGFVYQGRRSAYRRRRHGNSSRACSSSQFVVFAQNHDQVGNRALGDRLSTQIPFDALKVATALVLLSPNIPLLFMGEEYGETAPFQYFIEHGDPQLIEAVRQGRRREFSHFGWKEEDIPDPQDVATFERSRLRPGTRDDPQRAAMLRWTNMLITLRRGIASLGAEDSGKMRHLTWHEEAEQVLMMHRQGPDGPEALLVLGFNNRPVTVAIHKPQGEWNLRLDSTSSDFAGSGQATMPRRLIVDESGVALSVPRFSAFLYLRSASGLE